MCSLTSNRVEKNIDVCWKAAADFFVASHLTFLDSGKRTLARKTSVAILAGEALAKHSPRMWQDV